MAALEGSPKHAPPPQQDLNPRPSSKQHVVFSRLLDGSAFEKEDGELARVVEVEGLVGLAGYLETKALAHNAVERVSILPIHLFLHQFAR